MRTNTAQGQYCIGSLTEIDALVGEMIMRETPAVHWEDSYAHFRFESLNEALEAMRDPVIQGFIPSDERSSTVLEEVREFRPYSSSLLAAWEVVERMRVSPIQLRRDGPEWVAAFGEAPEMRSSSVALTICLAALRARGVDVAFGETDSNAS
jgi:hypothetical protein